MTIKNHYTNLISEKAQQIKKLESEILDLRAQETVAIIESNKKLIEKFENYMSTVSNHIFYQKETESYKKIIYFGQGEVQMIIPVVGYIILKWSRSSEGSCYHTQYQRS